LKRVLYEKCADCGTPKTTYSQKKSPLCFACRQTKRHGHKPHYDHCIDCGEQKLTPSEQRSSRCLKCRSNPHCGENNNRWSGGPIKRNCEICGTEFFVSSCRLVANGGRFCSSKCYGIHKHQTTPQEKQYTCDGCGNTFFAKHIRRFCSKECKREWSMKRRGKDNQNWKGGPPKYTCEECGKEFSSHNQKPRFCSVPCRSKWNSKHHSGENHYHWQGGKVDRTCIFCGNPFKVAKCLVEKGGGKFCSHACYERWQSENLSGENSYQWLGGNHLNRIPRI